MVADSHRSSHPSATKWLVGHQVNSGNPNNASSPDFHHIDEGPAYGSDERTTHSLSDGNPIRSQPASVLQHWESVTCTSAACRSVGTRCTSREAKACMHEKQHGDYRNIEHLDESRAVS
ncbi:hypothetical protein ACLOJK_019078 [Asimina triloba]